jgi:hypothetical protein
MRDDSINLVLFQQAKGGSMRRSKKECEVIHAKRRLYERYGLELKKDQRERIIQFIRKRDARARFVKRMSLRLSCYFVWAYERWLPLVYDKRRHELVTFLPPNALGEPPPSLE